ncbi:fumarylacetoacetate hydrolase [Odoribacter sp. OttesenSCG-928-J03]|nr:fumarylacetoacetate hydrolase [Odoribacter sp. OttesenSCG-928-J03]MDL2330423.1 fumarylacetoacetate hydrolase [Odoribacter sp. OttesenSCG-928-A06]
MKLICAEYNSRKEMSLSVVGDNALLRNNNDFYYPGFTKELSCVPQIVFKACKLGKGVSSRFAPRYYNEIGVGIRFYADTLEQELLRKELPSIQAASFDESAALSKMRMYEGEEISYRLLVNDTPVFDGRLADLQVDVDRFISESSDYFMIKIGDFFFCGNTYRYHGLKIDDHLQMYMNEECLLDFYIR